MKAKITKKIIQTRKKSSRLWKSYRTKKKQILSKKTLPLDLKRGLISEAREVTKSNISTAWEDYRGFKFGFIHHSRYEDFSFVKSHQTYGSHYRGVKQTPGTVQEFYKASNYYNENNLDEQVQNILNEPHVLGVGVVLRVEDLETELIQHGSDYITKGLLEKIHNRGKNVYDHVLEKLRKSKSFHEFEVRGIYIRIIYEKS